MNDFFPVPKADYCFILKLETKGWYLTTRLHGVTFLQKVSSIARYEKKWRFVAYVNVIIFVRDR